jgi:hypothetical protein
MSTRQAILDQLVLRPRSAEGFSAKRFATDLQGWHSEHPI